MPISSLINSRTINAVKWISAVGIILSVAAAGCAKPLSNATNNSNHKQSHPPSIVTVPIQTVTTSDGTVSYRSVGNGPTILMIMGYSSSMDGWPSSLVDPLASTHRVITFDNAGIGQTTMPAGTLTISSMAQQTDAFIHALHLGEPAVLGWSMGGMIAQALTVLHPSDVSKLILCATLPGNGKGTPPAASAVAALSNPGVGSAATLLGLLFPADQQSTQIPLFTSEISKYPNFYLAPSSVDSEQLTALANWYSGNDPAGIKIGDISVPTLIGDGADDILIPAANDTVLHQVIRHSSLVMYPDAGHGFVFQDAKDWTARIEKFLG